MNNWLTLDQNISLEEYNNFKPKTISAYDTQLMIEQSYYDLLLSIRKNEIDNFKNSIIPPYNNINTSMILESFNNSSSMIDTIFTWPNIIRKYIRDYMLYYNKNTEFQLKQLKKIANTDMISKYPVRCRVELFKDFRPLDFLNRFEDLFMNGLDVRDEDVWMKEREVSYKVFTRQFPEWFMLSTSLSKMKDNLYDGSTQVTRKMEYNLKILFDRVDKYLKDMKIQFKEDIAEFSKMKAIIKSMNMKVSKARNIAIQRRKKMGEEPSTFTKLFDTDYIGKLTNSYSLAIKLVLDALLRYYKALYSVYIDQFEGVKDIINSMYHSLSLKDRRDIASMYDIDTYYDVSRSLLKNIRRELM